MSVTPASAGVEQIVRRTTTLPNPLVSSANGTGINPVPPFGTTQQFAWVATNGCHRLRARHSGKGVNVVGAATADLALLEQRT